MNLKITIAFIIFLIFLSPVRSSAEMAALSETELSRIVAGAGIDIDVKGSAARITVESVYVGDSTDHNTDTPELDFNKMEFNNIVIDDGAGGYFSFDTPADKPITIDVGTNASGKTIARIGGSGLFVSPVPILISSSLLPILPFNPVPLLGIPVVSFLSSGSEPRWYSAGSLVFCDQDIGSLYMDRVTLRDEILNIGAHGGVDFDYAGRVDIGEFRYTYRPDTNPDPDIDTSLSLKAAGIHLAASVVNTPENPDDPAAPATWDFTGPFKIGDIFAAPANPATIDVGTDNISGKTSMFLNLPMQGCLRIENVSFGGQDFGPCAIDGIKVHRLQIQMPGS